jgi:hypothetical protein
MVALLGSQPQRISVHRGQFSAQWLRFARDECFSAQTVRFRVTSILLWLQMRPACKRLSIIAFRRWKRPDQLPSASTERLPPRPPQ